MAGPIQNSCLVVRSDAADPVVLSGFAVRGSADDKSRVWIKALTEYGFMAGAMLAVNASDGSTLWCYTHNHRFDNLSGRCYFGFPTKLWSPSSTSVSTGLRYAWARTRFGQLWRYIGFLSWIERRRLW